MPDVAPADHGPAFPPTPFKGQLWCLTGTVGAQTPNVYIYESAAWAAFTGNSIAPPGPS